MVSPALHHCAALVEIFGVIVRSAHGVLLLVSKLALDYVGRNPISLRAVEAIDLKP
jgi:hypothetical protein